MCVTLYEVRVVGLVRSEDGRHLVVVRRVDVFINTVPGQLYLLKELGLRRVPGQQYGMNGDKEQT